LQIRWDCEASWGLVWMNVGLTTRGISRSPDQAGSAPREERLEGGK
jgi:hypothetical protein